MKRHSALLAVIVACAFAACDMDPAGELGLREAATPQPGADDARPAEPTPSPSPSPDVDTTPTPSATPDQNEAPQDLPQSRLQWDGATFVGDAELDVIPTE